MKEKNIFLPSHFYIKITRDNIQFLQKHDFFNFGKGYDYTMNAFYSYRDGTHNRYVYKKEVNVDYLYNMLVKEKGVKLYEIY